MDGANLDRIQVIKGWLDAAGKPQEKVYDVAWSGNRKPDAKGKLPAVGSTVNVAEATYDNSIGSPALQAFWKDPSFDPKQRAFYYVRVLEIPTPRWTTYDAKFFKVKLPTGGRQGGGAQGPMADRDRLDLSWRTRWKQHRALRASPKRFAVSPRAMTLSGRSNPVRWTSRRGYLRPDG